MKVLNGMIAERTENGYSGQVMFAFRRGFGVVRKKLYFKLDMNDTGPYESYLKIYNEEGRVIDDQEIWQIIFDLLIRTVSEFADSKQPKVFIDETDESVLDAVRHL